jgi:hypothetical protein
MAAFRATVAVTTDTICSTRILLAVYFIITFMVNIEIQYYLKYEYAIINWILL